MMGDTLPGQLCDSFERDWAKKIAGSSTPERAKKNLQQPLTIDTLDPAQQHHSSYNVDLQQSC